MLNTWTYSEINLAATNRFEEFHRNKLRNVNTYPWIVLLKGGQYSREHCRRYSGHASDREASLM